MTEKEFLLLYKERKNLKSIREAKEIFETFWLSLTDILDKDEKIIVKDWAIFEKKLMKPKKVFNIQTRKIMTTEEKRIIKFKPSKKMLEKLEEIKPEV